MRDEISFATEDGTLLRGMVHRHGHRRPAPAIVMAAGFSGVREQIDHYAACFATAGFVVLVYDHRGFGSSDGEPRLEVDPAVQLADWRDAITFAQGLPQVDAARPLGIWGSSFAGGLAIVLAANDARIGCVVAQIPNVSGHRNAVATFTVAERDEIERRLGADLAGRLAGDSPAMIPVFAPDDALCALPRALSQGGIDAALAAAPSWRNEITLRSLQNAMTYEPAAWVPYVSPTPLLMIVGARDRCTFAEIQLDVFESAREPKRLLVHPGGHFDTYTTHFEETGTAARDWFAAHLLVADASKQQPNPRSPEHADV